VRAHTQVPILLVALAAALIVIIALGRRMRARPAGSRPNVAQTTGDVTAEVTAEQLAGRPGAAANTTQQTQTQGTGRRPRRNRRTPSQMSTKSLPAYNKEPHEQELVVYK
jgi:hypothetical protein